MCIRDSCDGARELFRAAVDLGICPSTSRPYVSQSNSIAERAIRHVEEGTRTVLLHAGLPPQWWPFAAKYFSFACNLDESRGPSPWSLRHGAPFKGLQCPFGALVDFLPPKPYLARLPKFGPRGVPGIFLGYHLHPGGHFRGEYLCITLDDLAAVQHAPDGTCLHPRVHRIKEVFVTKGNTSFPAQDALARSTRQLGGDPAALPLPVPVDATAGGGHAPAESGTETTQATAGSSNAAETIFYPRDDLPPPAFTTNGAEVETDSPPALTPLAAEFECYKYTLSECGKYEIIGDRWIQRKKNSQRVPGVLPELWSLLSQEQRNALRARWHLHTEAGAPPGIPAPATEEGGPIAAAVAATKVDSAQENPEVADTPLKASTKGKKGAVADTPRAPIPAMPVVPPGIPQHREHLDPDPSQTLLAMVARPVTRKEISTTIAASQSLHDEAPKLVQKGAWDPSGVREWQAVADDARRTGEKAHVGRIFGIVVENHPELPSGHPERTYKGRLVFQGNEVRDENAHYAIFSDLSSNPATLEASKNVDAYGLLPGNALQKADGEQAYIQAPLGGISGGVKTWARLPRDMWPKSFQGLRDPVVPVMKAIYGHPQSGGHWEEYCETALRKAGWHSVPEWPSVFWFPKYRLLLMVYVDDFKMAGPAEHLEAGWKTITEGIKLVGIGPVST